MTAGFVVHHYVLATMDVQPTAPGYESVMAYCAIIWSSFPNEQELSTLFANATARSGQANE